MKRVPRLLLAAFALSLLLHLVVALILHPPTPTPENQAEVVSIEHRPATIAVTKVPTPPPTTPAYTVAACRELVAAPTRKGTRTGGGVRGQFGRCSHARRGTDAAADCDVRLRLRARECRRRRRCNAEPARHRHRSPCFGDERYRARDGASRRERASCERERGAEHRQLVARSGRRVDGPDARYTPAVHDCKPIASAYTFSVKFVAW